jgi:hypothetical protein
MAILDVFRDIKNSTISALAKKFINNNIKEYGEMVNLKVDSKNKNIEIDVLLKGEKENIVVKIEKYEIVSRKDSNAIKFKNVSASRKWIEILINNVAIPSFAPKRMIEIDSTYAKILDLVI